MADKKQASGKKQRRPITKMVKRTVKKARKRARKAAKRLHIARPAPHELTAPIPRPVSPRGGPTRARMCRLPGDESPGSARS